MTTNAHNRFRTFSPEVYEIVTELKNIPDQDHQSSWFVHVRHLKVTRMYIGLRTVGMDGGILGTI